MPVHFSTVESQHEENPDIDAAYRYGSFCLRQDRRATSDGSPASFYDLHFAADKTQFSAADRNSVNVHS